jgi:nucleoid-associated protein YgaU
VSIAFDIRPPAAPARRSCPAPAQPPGARRPCVIIEFPGSVAAPRPARATRPRRAERHPVRLTRRGRRLAVSALGAVVVGSVGVGAHALAGTAGAAPTMAPRTSSAAVVVRAGDTLWSIARTVAPAQDPRAVVATLRIRNHLSTGTVRPGQRLVVPGGGP